MKQIKRRRPQYFPLFASAIGAILLLSSGCLDTLPAESCDQDGDGYCREAMGNMPGGDCCDRPGDVGCGDATMMPDPGSIYPGAPETCGDLGIDNNCNLDTEDVDDRHEICETGICFELSCRCFVGHYDCQAGELQCVADATPALDEPCNGVDDNCNRAEDIDDIAAHLWCREQPGASSTAYCLHDACRDGCLGDIDCDPQGNVCDTVTNRCLCGADVACSGNFVCVDSGHGRECLCGDDNIKCGFYESCSADGECMCGDVSQEQELGGEACPDTSNAPDCHIGVDPPRCDCNGELCHQNQACCDALCVDTSTDPDYCGSCDIACDQDAGQVCCAGVCIESQCPLE